MGQENICQFYIIVGDKDFKPLNKKDVYINATGVNDINLIRKDISDKYKEKMSMETPAVVSNKIIFLVPNNEFYGICDEIVNRLGIMYYETEFISEYISKNDKSQNMDNVKKVETELRENRNITASGSENIEVQKDTGIQNITTSNDKAYINSGLLSIDEQKRILLQEWQNDPYMYGKLVDLSKEEIDRMLIESVTSNMTAYRMESSREQNAYDEASNVAKDKAATEDGLYNSELRIVRNNVSDKNKYSVVEERGGQVQVVNPDVSNASINSGGISNDFGGRTEEGIIDENVQSRENLGEYYLDEEYNVYDNNGNIMGRVGQNGVWVDFNTNTLVVNGNLVGYVGDYKDMGKSSESLNKRNVRVKRKDENKRAAFVSFPVIMFVLSAMLLIGSVILLFVLK